jgi:hypothetical protein
VQKFRGTASTRLLAALQGQAPKAGYAPSEHQLKPWSQETLLSVASKFEGNAVEMLEGRSASERIA